MADEEPKKKEEVQPEDSDGGEEPKEDTEVLDKIDQANAAAKRLEDANNRKEELLIREEKLKANEILGGKSEVTKKKSKDDEITEGARALAGNLPCEGVND